MATWLTAGFAAWLLRLWGWTWRLQEIGSNPLADPRTADGPHVAAIWHRDLLMAAWLHRDRGFSVSVSRSRDGDRISALLTRLGYSDPSRGSSSRGGPASLLGLVRRVQAGTTVSMLVDGPRGPAARAKPGILTLARLTQTPITPLCFTARPALRFASWDRTVLPLPFARVTCRYGEPLTVPPDTPPEAEADLIRELEARLGS
jgi:lysophospholipid acyltransferase (LPLAT)-like uncharacterized protein